jgi:hypothetical protein
MFGFRYLPFEETVHEVAEQYLEAKKEGFSVKVLPF